MVIPDKGPGTKSFLGFLREARLSALWESDPTSQNRTSSQPNKQMRMIGSVIVHNLNGRRSPGVRDGTERPQECSAPPAVKGERELLHDPGVLFSEPPSFS